MNERPDRNQKEGRDKWRTLHRKVDVDFPWMWQVRGDWNPSKHDVAIHPVDREFPALERRLAETSRFQPLLWIRYGENWEDELDCETSVRQVRSDPAATWLELIMKQLPAGNYLLNLVVGEPGKAPSGGTRYTIYRFREPEAFTRRLRSLTKKRDGSS